MGKPAESISSKSNGRLLVYIHIHFSSLFLVTHWKRIKLWSLLFKAK